MLIYNYKKEFLGIDESDLKALGFSSVAELLTATADFADLFIKAPGLIHNFNHVHWIDYIACNESGADAKAIISAKDRKFTTNVAVKTIYLIDNPSQKAFIIELLNLKSLSQTQEAQIITTASTQRAEQKTIMRDLTPPKKEPSYESQSPRIIKDPYEEESNEPVYAAPSKPREITIDMHDLLAEEPVVQKAEPVVQAIIKEPLPEVKLPEIEEVSPFESYVYDPQVASHDLGLPIDLVEEFIQDFIAQANSFKKDLYNSLKHENMDNLKIQSHKLKGVAANLRIEDALDALKIVNTSYDEHEINTNLDRFYKIINKLAKNENAEVAPSQTSVADKEDDEDLILSFKDEPLILKQSEPSYVEIPEVVEIEKPIEDNYLTPYEEPLEIIDDEADVVLHYDKAKIAYEMGLDIESFNELFDDYLIEVKEIILSLESAVQNGDLSAYKNAALKFKGMNENMRIHEFDTSLEGILSAVDTVQIRDYIEQSIAILTLISKKEDK
ncbi:MAG: hypothetical protein OEL19_01730 [Sulfurimonas sp.]|nr:hypothetical protein [Sulfurimonas sp.]